MLLRAVISAWLLTSTVTSLRRREEDPTPQSRAWSDVPFYMYQLPEWSRHCHHADRQHNQNVYPDISLYDVMSNHPWRVQTPSEAKLFVVPAYLSLSAYGWCGDHSANLHSLYDSLQSSEFFKASNGSDHVISAFAWRLDPDHVTAAYGPLAPLLQRMIVAHYESKDYERAFPVPYGPVDVGLGLSSLARDQRSHSVFFMGQADWSLRYRTRRIAISQVSRFWPDSKMIQALEPTEGWKIAFPECRGNKTTGCWMNPSYDDYVAFGRQSKYGLVIQGDTPSTSRLYDLLQFEQTPVIISKGFQDQAMPFPDELPWSDFAIFVDPDAFEAEPQRLMEDAIQQASNKTKLELWKKVRPALDWSIRSVCIGTAVLSHVARRFLDGGSLSRAWDTPHCQSPVQSFAAIDAHAQRPNVAELKKVLMEERFA